MKHTHVMLSYVTFSAPDVRDLAPATKLFETKAITLSRTMPIFKKISEASRQVSEWLQSPEEPFKRKDSRLRLKRVVEKDMEHVLHYEILEKGGGVTR